MPRFVLLLTLFVSLGFAACAKRSRARVPTIEQSSAVLEKQSATRININTASARELENLPGIGRGLADRIIEHREKYGPFRRAEHLMMVRGISDARFRALQNLIKVE